MKGQKRAIERERERERENAARQHLYLLQVGLNKIVNILQNVLHEENVKHLEAKSEFVDTHICVFFCANSVFG